MITASSTLRADSTADQLANCVKSLQNKHAEILKTQKSSGTLYSNDIYTAII